MRRVLVLGGTTEASRLVAALAGRVDVEVITSLAGRTSSPSVAAGAVRVGGFGGAAGLATYLRDERIDVLVDGTHPFAARMRWHARAAADEVGLPCVRVERPPWRPQPGDDWRSVPDLGAAATAIDDFARVFLTTGRQELEPFAACGGVWFLIRTIEPPGPLPFGAFEVVLARGPFEVDDEVALMRDHRIDAVVTKNSGGDATVAKLVAARGLGLPVVMVDRPGSPDGPLVESVADALVWFDAQAAG